MDKPWKEYLEKITPYAPGKPVDEVKRELGVERVIKLASNEIPYGPSRKVLAAVEKAISDVNRYPDGGCFYLRQKLSSETGVPPENIVFGNGSDELIILAIRSMIAPGERVIISDPTFMVYKIASRVSQADIFPVPAIEFRYDLEGMLSAINEKTKIIFIANPENPTGTCIGPAEMEDFISKVPPGIVVFLDEAYFEFAVREGDFPSSFALSLRTDRNVIVSRTFSKAYGLAGLRIGYAVMNSRLAGIFNRIREPFNVNSIAQSAAIAALEDKENLEMVVDTVIGEKSLICEALDLIDVEYIPSRTNFVLVNTKRDSKKVYRGLLEKGVVVREMSGWGLDGYIRVSVGLPEENRFFVEIFKDVIGSLPVL